MNHRRRNTVPCHVASEADRAVTRLKLDLHLCQVLTFGLEHIKHVVRRSGRYRYSTPLAVPMRAASGAPLQRVPQRSSRTVTNAQGKIHCSAKNEKAA